MKDLENEVWKDIPGYEGLYQASNFGRIRNNKGEAPYMEKSQKGYIRASLSVNGIHKHEKVHRLVALTFLPNPDNLPQINHIDEDKTNNTVFNLEWVNNHTNSLLNTNKTRGKRKVCKIDNGVIIATYDCVNDASRENGVSRYGINAACIGTQKTAGGFQWKYVG